MEARNVAREDAHHGAEAVWVFQREIWVVHQPLHPCQNVWYVCAGLHSEPFVDDERIALGVLEELLHGLASLWCVWHLDQMAKGSELVGHATPVAGLLELRRAQGQRGGVLRRCKVAQANVPEATFPSVEPVDDERLSRSRRQLLVALLELGGERTGDGGANCATGLVQPDRIDRRLHGLHESGLRGQDEGVGQEAQVWGLLVRQDAAQGVHKADWQLAWTPWLGNVCLLDGLGAQCLGGLPSVEGICVIGREEGEVVVGVWVVQLYGCREVPQQGGHRLGGEAVEGKGLLGARKLEHAAGHDLLAIGTVQEPDHDRDQHRFLPAFVLWEMRLAGAHLLPHCQCILAVAGVPLAAGLHLWCPWLQVPLLELREVPAVGVGHGCAEVVARDGASIVALKVEVHTLAKAIPAKEGLVHPDHLRTLAIDCRGVEVVHRNVALRSDGVCHWATVLRELPCSQEPDLFNALHRGAAHVS
mmetsp:Transcript_21126/g.52913  ORF Transcript_21126/g.52913 Transcript_21126/m.52913 type:complete len:474 (-) Transcript_21126:1080-2501(-)